MKSIQSKVILLILISIFVSTLLLGSIGLLTSQKVIDDYSTKIMNSMCEEKAEEFNNILSRIEQTVDILSKYVISNLDDIEHFSNNNEYRAEYISNIDELAIACALETEGAVSIYVRFNPEIAPPKEGLFRVKNNETSEFEEHWITDLTQYTDKDVEYAGWYFIPVNAGKAIWLEPYYNRNTEVYMISYVSPIYFEETLVGVVGMDIDFSYLTDIIDSMSVYDSGYAFITDTQFNIVHHRNLAVGTSVKEFSRNKTDIETVLNAGVDSLFEYEYEGRAKKAAFGLLNNGMCLAFSAPSSEIDKTKNDFFNIIIIITFLIMAVFFLIASYIARTIVSPLKELNKAAKEIAKGNLDVNLPKKSDDEVGMLTESLTETAKQLKIRINYINKLAYTDKLTEVNNNTAFINTVTQLDCDKKAVYSIAVVDVNGLKYINDNYGHDSGNYLIIAAADMLSSVFGRSNVYRTGGDEFAVVLKNVGMEECFGLEAAFNKALEEQSGDIILSAAIGTSTFDSKVDEGYESVYKRADLVMYTRKSDMKSKGMTSILKKQL